MRHTFPATIAQGDGWALAVTPPAPVPQAAAVNDGIETVDVTTLMGGRRSVRIAHAGVLYRLSLTRLNKLILTREIEA